MLARAPDELHEGSLFVLGTLLRRRRRPIDYLGQAVLLPDLADFVGESRPLAVVLLAMPEEAAGALTEWLRWLTEAAGAGRPVITFGGRTFNEQPEWRTGVPGIFLGETLGEGMETLERVLRDAMRPEV